MKSVEISNEEALCEALIRLLENELGAVRTDVTYPERDGSGPPVEIRARIGERRIAIEHTLVEPFSNSIQMGKHFVELTAELESELDGNMPKPGVYTLVFPVHPTDGRHRRTHADLRKQMSAWITATAAEMHAEYPARKGRRDYPNRYYETRLTEIDGIPLELSRRVDWSESGRHDGKLFLVRNAGNDVESLRLIRMRAALASKLPKLADCAELGDTTFLILEWSDIALSNHIVIGRALEAALAEREDRPDYVFLADTATDHWHFFQPVIGGQFSIDMEFIDIDPPDGSPPREEARGLVEVPPRDD